jgi:hypothetical protein
MEALARVEAMAAAPFLLGMLDDEKVRHYAIRSIGHAAAGSADGSLIATLVALGEEFPFTRGSIGEALLDIGGESATEKAREWAAQLPWPHARSRLLWKSNGWSAEAVVTRWRNCKSCPDQRRQPMWPIQRSALPQTNLFGFSRS